VAGDNNIRTTRCTIHPSPPNQYVPLPEFTDFFFQVLSGIIIGTIGFYHDILILHGLAAGELKAAESVFNSPCANGKTNPSMRSERR
jgi:hypothetical protein